MSEKDPYAQKRKDSNAESRMESEGMNSTGKDTNPDVSGSSRNPKDDINPVRPRANMPDQETDEDTENRM